MNILQAFKGILEEDGYHGIVFTIRRESDFWDKWVLRDRQGNYLDSDYSRLALANRNGLNLEEV